MSLFNILAATTPEGSDVIDIEIPPSTIFALIAAAVDRLYLDVVFDLTGRETQLEISAPIFPQGQQVHTDTLIY